MLNVILVDSSYTSFHRFFATLRWFSLAHMEIFKEHKDNPSYDWSKQPLFIEKYTKMYLDSIINLVTRAVYENSIIIFCLDSQNTTLWRHDIGECYKGKRQDLSEKRNFKPTFQYTYNELIPNLTKLRITSRQFIFMMQVPRMEADDLIALASRYIRYKKPNYIQYIVSGDNDFLQLGYKNLYIADYKKKELIHLSKEEAKEALRQKLINGDCSDNIPSIFLKEIKVSNKDRKLIRENKQELIKYLNNNKTAMEQYLHNKKMISFKYIPKHFRKPVYRMVKQSIEQL